MERKRIAVIGAGVAGLSSAWILSRHHDVLLFEKNDYLGGHSHTIEVDTPEGPVGVDTGFVVFNYRNYPRLTRLFQCLGVESQTTDMSFSASIDHGRIEYAGSNLDTLFGQRRNLLRPSHWCMVKDILRFNREAKQALATGAAQGLSLGDYLLRGGYGAALCHRYLLPMAAAIWSCPAPTMLEFPAASFLRFFENHGLLNLADRPQWRTVCGGSQQYVRRMWHSLAPHVHVAEAATKVVRGGDKVSVYTERGAHHDFDEVVLACHADEALKLLEQPKRMESEILGSFCYQENRAILHSDRALMPVRPRVWSSWNYLATSRAGETNAVSVSYWMNRLQRLPGERQFFVSLNPLTDPRSETVVAEMTYHHPVFDEQAVAAQRRLSEIQGEHRVWFCGSYAGYGFHEDALRSALNVTSALGVLPPWEDESADASVRQSKVAAAEPVVNP